MSNRIHAYLNRAASWTFVVKVPVGDAAIPLDSVVFRVGPRDGSTSALLELPDTDASVTVSPALSVTTVGMTVTVAPTATQIAILGSTPGTFCYDLECIATTGTRRLNVGDDGSGTLTLTKRLD